MKKICRIIALVFAFSLLFSLTTFAHNAVEPINNTYTDEVTLVFENDEEKLDYLKSGNLLENVKYTFIVKSSVMPRYSICGNCGDSGMNRYTKEVEVGIYPVVCPDNQHSFNSDIVHKYEIYQVEDCYICDYHVETGLGIYTWYVQCYELAGTYEQIIPGASMSDGHSAHECIDISQFED